MQSQIMLIKEEGIYFWVIHATIDVPNKHVNGPIISSLT